MSDMARIRVTWSGTPVVGPGISTFYVQGTVTAGWPAALVTLFTAIRNYVPTGVTWTVPGIADILNVETGVLTGSNSPGGGGTVTSAGGAVDFKPGVGGRIRWGTGGIVAGRKVIGTTFLVPLTSQEYPNGTIQAGTVTAITNAATTYGNSAGFNPAIYSKPTSLRAGTIHDITSAAVPSGETWLRSRRT